MVQLIETAVLRKPRGHFKRNVFIFSAVIVNLSQWNKKKHNEKNNKKTNYRVLAQHSLPNKVEGELASASCKIDIRRLPINFNRKCNWSVVHWHSPLNIDCVQLNVLGISHAARSTETETPITYLSHSCCAKYAKSVKIRHHLIWLLTILDLFEFTLFVTFGIAFSSYCCLVLGQERRFSTIYWIIYWFAHYGASLAPRRKQMNKTK